MIGFTCRAHLATTLKGREPVLCRRWVPSFATCCADCGTPRDRFCDPLETAARVMRKAAGATRAFRAHKAAARLARGSPG